MARKKASPRSAANLTALDDILMPDGTLKEFEAIAIKEVRAWHLADAMKAGDRRAKAG